MSDHSSKKESKIYAFIKAVDNQYFESFITKGEICMNTAKWFRDYEKDDNNIGDSGEGAIITCGTDFTIKFADPILNYTSEDDLKEQLKNRNWSDPFNGVSMKMFDGRDANIFSLYAITYNAEGNKYTHKVPEKFLKEFSHHKFILILYPRTFTYRIGEKLTEMGKKPYGCMVKYYPFDNIMRKNLSFFDKQDKYSYQNEYRIIYEENNPSKQVFAIGSIKDISLEIDLYNHSYRGNFNGLDITIILDRDN
jgi:hypothetical protein